MSRYKDLTTLITDIEIAPGKRVAAVGRNFALDLAQEVGAQHPLDATSILTFDRVGKQTGSTVLWNRG